jgi:transcriptional regulator with PAS, ATPase and Fis domain
VQVDDRVCLVGTSVSTCQLRQEVSAAARSDAKVLILGETGVGKEVVAQLIHRQSRRNRSPLVTINCAGIPDTLLESEMFGHVRGSFTDAHRDKAGRLEMAHGGTVFLDEVGEMSLRMQALLLRFLETGEIQRVGADTPQRPLDVRVIAATNRNLRHHIAAKEFREDLYYRLNVVLITIPALRERRDDIPALMEHFLRVHAQAAGVTPLEISREAMDTLVAYDWPGNVRELRNVVERIQARVRHTVVRPEHLPRLSPADVGPLDARASVAAPPPADALYERMTRGGESFWTVIHEPFVAHDLRRDDVRAIVHRGLQETRGNYKLLLPLYNMRETDYKRFLQFLRKHQCHVPFQPFRALQPGRAERFTAAASR